VIGKPIQKQRKEIEKPKAKALRYGIKPVKFDQFEKL
jgi:hypothetical protein